MRKISLTLVGSSERSKTPMPPESFNGCHSRTPYRDFTWVQDGWLTNGQSRQPRMVQIPFRMARDCQYTNTDLGQADPKCRGCLWRAK